MIRECRLIPSCDDERDWILDSYYQNLEKKNKIRSRISKSSINGCGYNQKYFNLENKQPLNCKSYNLALNIGVTFSILYEWFS